MSQSTPMLHLPKLTINNVVSLWDLGGPIEITVQERRKKDTMLKLFVLPVHSLFLLLEKSLQLDINVSTYH